MLPFGSVLGAGGNHRGSKTSYLPWLVPAVGLHAVLLLLLGPPRAPAETSATASAPDLELDVELVIGVDAAPAAPHADSVMEPAQRVARFTPPVAPRDSLRAPADRAAEAEANDADSTELAPAPERDEPPALSLQELGLGPHNPFVGSDLARRPPTRERSRPAARSSRFERSLAEAQLLEEHAKGLGPAGPALRELETATRNAEVPANSHARFRVVTDATGKVVRLELRESSSDPLPWQRIARRVLAALGAQALRIPKTDRGVTFELSVESRQTLPSGADPGLAINVLGIPLAEGSGERSHRLEILNIKPKLETRELVMPSGQKAEIPTLSLGSILSLAADPADIGAPAQRVVHARVEALNVNEE